jgi:hypothetical protein
MSFELGFIKRAMEYGLCYVDAELLYKQANSKLNSKWGPDARKKVQQGVNAQGKGTTSFSEQIRRGLRSGYDEAAGTYESQITDPSELVGGPNYIPRTGLTAFAHGAGEFIHDNVFAPPKDAVKQSVAAYNSARNGDWSNALKSGGKAVGNAAVTATSIVPFASGLNWGARIAIPVAGGILRSQIAEPRLDPFAKLK